jgi:hypothetical protein
MVFPYLKGLVIILCGFFYIALWIYCVFSICGDYIGISIQDLNSHPHHIEMQKSSRQGHVHEHIYAPAGHQTGNRSR